jgi:hypothetical protein
MMTRASLAIFHRPAHAFHHLAGDHPTGEIAEVGDFHRAEDRKIDMARRESSRIARTGCTLFDQFDGVWRMHDALDENAGRMDRVGIDISRRDDMLDLRDRHLAGGGHYRIEITRRLAIDKIAFRVALIGVDDRDIGDESALHDIGRPVKVAQLLAIGNDSSNARLGKERRDASAARPDSLGERPLRIEFDFEFAGKIKLLEKLVFADIRRDHLFDLPSLEEEPQARAIDARVVRDHGQILDLELANGRDQDLRDAAKAKSPRHEGHPVLENAGQGRARVGKNLVHACSSAGIRLSRAVPDQTPHLRKCHRLPAGHRRGPESDYRVGWNLNSVYPMQ